jgi:hypothetical protein
VSGDLGYPSTVELEKGILLTVWYEVTAGAKLAVLRQARWRIENSAAHTPDGTPGQRGVWVQ